MEFKPLVALAELPEPSRLEKICWWIPLAGWIVAGSLREDRLTAGWRKADEQLALRPPVPPEVWGDDPLRRRIAAFVAADIRIEVCWCSSRFIPEDPFKIMIDDPYPGMSLQLVILDIEQQWRLKMTDKEWQAALEMTFGQVVDLIMEKSPLTCEERLPAVPTDDETEQWAKGGNRYLGKLPCATGSVFRDIRGFLRDELGLEGAPIRPSTRMRGLVPPKGMARLDAYLKERFGIPTVLGGFWGSVPLILAWGFLSLAASIFIATALKLAGVGGYFRTVPPPCVVLMPAAVMAYAFHKRWQHRLRRGIRTAGDLARWIVKEATPTA